MIKRIKKIKRKRSKRSVKAGVSPGTLMHIGDENLQEIDVALIDFNETLFDELKVKKIVDHLELLDRDTVSWLNMTGIHSADEIQQIGSHFNVDELVLEDIMNANHRPKVEEHEKYLFIVIKMLSLSGAQEVDSEQVSIILFKDKLLSFQERSGDVFEPIRERIRASKGRVRKLQSDYLGIILLDIVVDNYFVVIETLGEKIDLLEEKVLDDVREDFIVELQQLKQQLVLVRKAVYPMRELLGNLLRMETHLILTENRKYIRDTYDHCVEIMDEVEIFMEQINSIRDLHISAMSNKMNQIMKVLTIISSLFIPLTFIAGIYGMNFKNIPEIESYQHGYITVLCVMVAITAGMLYYFRKKGWF
jgi:magnesium transporter